MTTESNETPLLSPSFAIASNFWEIAQEEYKSVNVYKQKDACEKAYRAATEAIDVLLASKGYKILVGEPEAHSQRADALSELGYTDPEIAKLAREYSYYKDILHGQCFYGVHNPLKHEKLFFSVPEFIEKIQSLLE